MKKKLFLTLFFAAMAGLLYLAFQTGNQRHRYTMEPLAKYVPIPHIYETYTGYAERLQGNEIKAIWNHTGLHPSPSRSYFTCIGLIPVQPDPYYVLEMDGRLYLDKAEHIEPLIHALCALSRGSDPEDHPQALADSIDCLPDDAKLLNKLVVRFKSKK